MSRADLTSLVTQLTSQNTSLQKRVSSLEAEVDLQSPSASSLGSIVASNRRSIARSLDVISSKVSSHDMATLEAALRGEVSRSAKLVSLACGPRAVTERTRDLAEALSSKLSALEALLAGKVDAGDLEAVRADAETVREAAREARDQGERLGWVEERYEELGGRVAGVEEVCVGNEQRAVLLAERLRAAATREEVEGVGRVAEETRRVVEGEVARSRDLARVEKVADAHGRKLAGIERALAEAGAASKRHAGRLEKLAGDAATRGELARCVGELVGRAEFKDAMARVGAEVDAKAWGKDVGKVRRDLEGLRHEHDTVTRVKAGLATKFVDWYGQKGEAYERNLEAVDGHLRNLAVQSYTTGKRREPYGDEHEL